MSEAVESASHIVLRHPETSKLSSKQHNIPSSGSLGVCHHKSFISQMLVRCLKNGLFELPGVEKKNTFYRAVSILGNVSSFSILGFFRICVGVGGVWALAASLS